jgi:uncharacterized protein with GYD domain
MPKFIVLSTFTEQGVKHFKDVPNRISDWKKKASEQGGEVKEVFAVMGAQFDTVSLVSAPSDETMARIALDLAALGNVHTQTLRAFGEDDLKKIVK